MIKEAQRFQVEKEELIKKLEKFNDALAESYEEKLLRDRLRKTNENIVDQFIKFYQEISDLILLEFKYEPDLRRDLSEFSAYAKYCLNNYFPKPPLSVQRNYRIGCHGNRVFIRASQDGVFFCVKPKFFDGLDGGEFSKCTPIAPENPIESLRKTVKEYEDKRAAYDAGNKSLTP
jgi:hypothetical protein